MTIFRFTPWRRGALGIVAGVVLAAASSSPAFPPGTPHPLTGETLYSLQLHIHGSFSEGSGSYEWHTDRAQQFGVDVLWWTDHDWHVENWGHTESYNFESTVWDAVNQRFEEPDDAYPGEFRYWEFGGALGSPETAISVVDSVAFEGDRSFRLELEQIQPAPQFATYYLKQTTSFQQNKYGLASRVKLRFALFPESFSAANSKFVVQVTASDHPANQPEIRYVVGSMAGEGPHSISLPFNPSTWTQYEVDVTSDIIAEFTSGGLDTLRGEDNALLLVRIGLAARNGAVPRVFFDGYEIARDESMSGDDLLDRSRAAMSYYETLYPEVSQFAGTEISRYRGQPHMNGFAPNLALVDYTGSTGADSLYYAVDQIHAQGGAVSLNHRFGTGISGFPEEPPEHQASRIRYEKIALIGNRAYGVDVLETGYRKRGGIDLNGHLSLWDALVGNAIFVTGDGVTDSHGPTLFNGWGPWQPGDGNFENNFVTWLYTREFSEAGFVHAMKAGRAFFGDPFLFDGSVDLLTSEGFPMGRIVLTDQTSHEVIIDVTDVPPSGKIRLLQGEIRENSPTEYTDINYLRDEILAGEFSGNAFRDTVTIDTSLPSFVRVEVRDSTSAPRVFSNPMHFVTQVPVFGIPPERLAARLDETRITSGENFTLTAASFLEPPRLMLVGNEEPSGTGSLTIDTGALGAPTGVSGAGAWNFSNGILTLTSFQGGASVVDVSWAPVGVTSSNGARALYLAPGRPNPFGRGISVEFVLPSPHHVKLDVFDVSGRYVRSLLEEARPAGSHSCVWDGRDERGESVANGLYVLRLSAGGRTLTTKAIKVR